MRCKSRRCASCGQLWAGDQRRRLVANLDAYPGPVCMATVTAPGKDVLPHDGEGRVRWASAYLFNKQCPHHWRQLHQRAAQETRRTTGRRPTVLAWVWQYQQRAGCCTSTSFWVLRLQRSGERQTSTSAFSQGSLACIGSGTLIGVAGIPSSAGGVCAR